MAGAGHRDRADPAPAATRGTLVGDVVDARGFPIDGASIEIVGTDGSGLPISETPQLLRFPSLAFQLGPGGGRPR